MSAFLIETYTLFTEEGVAVFTEPIVIIMAFDILIEQTINNSIHFIAEMVGFITIGYLLGFLFVSGENIEGLDDGNSDLIFVHAIPHSIIPHFGH
jgi:hypothetical protein